MDINAFISNVKTFKHIFSILHFITFGVFRPGTGMRWAFNLSLLIIQSLLGTGQSSSRPVPLTSLIQQSMNTA